jgi:hypothetical protein
MEKFINDFAKLAWLNAKYAKKEETVGFLMLYSAVQHPENMKNMLPFGYDLAHTQEDIREF